MNIFYAGTQYELDIVADGGYGCISSYSRVVIVSLHRGLDYSGVGGSEEVS